MELDNFFDEMVAQGMVDYHLFSLNQISIAAGSTWDCNDHSTMEIVVTPKNADSVYGCCKEIQAVRDNGLTRRQMKKVKEARQQAHRYLYDEANDPNTPIERKIELVRLTSKNGA